MRKKAFRTIVGKGECLPYLLFQVNPFKDMLKSLANNNLDLSKLKAIPDDKINANIYQSVFFKIRVELKVALSLTNATKMKFDFGM